MSTHEHEHDPVEPPVLDDYGRAARPRHQRTRRGLPGAG